MKRKTALALILVVILSLTLTFSGCGSDNPGGTGRPDGSGYSGNSQTPRQWELSDIPVAGDEIQASDYSDEDNWMLLPSETDKPVDAFYLYPTSWGVSDSSEYPICGIDHKKMRKTAAGNAQKQATAFETAANLYAPFYRQVAVAFVLAEPQEERASYFGGVPAADAIAAFDYYIKHYNEGRPFILVGHSQGAAVIKELLFTYMKDHPDVYSRMVAAYVIGYSVTEQELAGHPWLKFAEGPADTGVIISYNTEAPKVDGVNNTVLPGSVAINPISWTRSETPASAEDSLGSFVKEKGKMTRVDHLADAAVNLERGTVVCSTVDRKKFKGKNPAFFPLGVYHSFDIALYYYDLRQNAEVRSAAFLMNQANAQ